MLKAFGFPLLNTDGGPKTVTMGRSGEKFNKFIWIKTHDINELVKGEKKY